MGNAQNVNKKPDSEPINTNMRVINSAHILQNQSLEYGNMSNFNVEQKMKQTLKFLEKNNFVSLKFVLKINLLVILL